MTSLILGSFSLPQSGIWDNPNFLEPPWKLAILRAVPHEKLVIASPCLQKPLAYAHLEAGARLLGGMDFPCMCQSLVWTVAWSLRRRFHWLGEQQVEVGIRKAEEEGKRVKLCPFTLLPLLSWESLPLEFSSVLCISHSQKL